MLNSPPETVVVTVSIETGEMGRFKWSPRTTGACLMLKAVLEASPAESNTLVGLSVAKRHFVIPMDHSIDAMPSMRHMH